MEDEAGLCSTVSVIIFDQTKIVSQVENYRKENGLPTDNSYQSILECVRFLKREVLKTGTQVWCDSPVHDSRLCELTLYENNRNPETLLMRKEAFYLAKEILGDSMNNGGDSSK